jgi:hypothetical protein
MSKEINNQTEKKQWTLYGVIWRKFLPFIPLLGIPLTVIYHHKYGDTGLENNTLNWLAAFWQAISFVVTTDFLFK